ncbi:MAG TPA: hypothetical protein PKH07_06545, partial [bacterium]|nr:hypothetical protein [bacterium]
MKDKNKLTNEEIVSSIREKLSQKNRRIAELEQTIAALRESLSSNQKELEGRDRLFQMLSDLLGEE